MNRRGTLLCSITVAGIQQRSVHAAKNNMKLKDRVYTQVCILHGEEKPHSPGGGLGCAVMTSRCYSLPTEAA